MRPNVLFLGDALTLLGKLEDESIDLIAIDPPFQTGKTQRLRSVQSVRHALGNEGFGGNKYVHAVRSDLSYTDNRDDYYEWMRVLMVESRRVLKNTGSIYVHLGAKNSHKVRAFALDPVFGENNWSATVIWDYDYGGRPKTRWANKHDDILHYAKDPKKMYFDYEAVPRVPYMAPGLVSAEKRKAGKAIHDVWWQTICPTNGSERVSYPTQKPKALYNRIVRVSCPSDGTVLDFVAGSGTTAVAAHEEGRHWIVGDQSEEAVRVMKKRFTSLGMPNEMRKAA